MAVLAGVAEHAAERSRVLRPSETGYIERDGVRVYWERYGSGGPAVVLLPTWSIVHSRFWKLQIPYLARHCRVITFDGRGNGHSGRPRGAESYHPDQFALDTLAVMDAAGTGRASLVGLSCGARWGTILAAEHADRVDGAVFIGPALALAPNHPEREVHAFDEPLETDDGWAKYNSHYWRKDYRDFLEFFFAKCCNEPHSTKQIEDSVAWALDTDPEVLADTTRGLGLPTREPIRETCARIVCPTLVIHGDLDLVRPHAQGRALAEATGGELVTLTGAGHMPMGRDPVKVNLLLRDFVERGVSRPDPTVHRPNGHPRALFVSSPIGLGHAQRDIAIARELRALRPDLQIDWLAQDPVTRVLEDEGETIHPQSVHLASESGHFQSESSGHDLHCFEAFRRMDEILLANFMLFHDVVSEGAYDLWIGDEAWELDHFLHEHPELKRAPFAWLTDFVGFLPMPDGDEREAFLTADYNAEMVEHVAGHPHVRDCSIFIGDPEDIVDERLGPDLPGIRAWTEQHFDFTSYISEFDPAQLPERDALRSELGYHPDEQVCIATVGGSGIGQALLRRVIDAYPEARRLVPGLRMIVIAGPRIDPDSLPFLDGLEVHAYVHNLYRHLAACDLAITQGGLATTMELTASRRPFIYFPLEHHFEQQFHVHHRLKRHRAGRRMEYAESSPTVLAEAIAQEIGRQVDYREVEVDGAANAARLLAELL